MQKILNNILRIFNKRPLTVNLKANGYKWEYGETKTFEVSVDIHKPFDLKSIDIKIVREETSYKSYMQPTSYGSSGSMWRPGGTPGTETYPSRASKKIIDTIVQDHQTIPFNTPVNPGHSSQHVLHLKLPKKQPPLKEETTVSLQLIVEYTVKSNIQSRIFKSTDETMLLFKKKLTVPSLKK